MNDAFSKFVDSEVSTWTAHSDNIPSSDLLVRVSGSLQSPIAHHAHQPSFTTLQPRNSETADETNPCIVMIMGNAFEKSNSLIYDHLLRRDEKSEGLKMYPEDIVRCHEAFIQKVRESMEAKVEVVYGKQVKERMLQKQAYEVDLLALWGEYEGVCIILDRESNYSNAQQGHRYRRVIVFAKHPQRFFYFQKGEWDCAIQDKLLAVAAKIAGVDFIKRYYEDQKWRMIVPHNFSSMTKKKLFGTPPKQSQSDRDSSNASRKALMISMSKPTTTEASIGLIVGSCWDSFFEEKPPFSVQELREILPVALATETDLDEHSHKWESPADFPEIVGTWFRGQREILFKGMSIYGPADIIPVYQRLYATEKGPLEGSPSLAEMIYGLIKKQARMIENLPTSNLDGLIYYGLRPFDLVETICFSCRQPLPLDTEARWSVKRLGHYVLRRRRCNTDLCQGKLRYAIPKDLSIQHVWPKLAALSIETARNISKDWQGCIRDPKDCKGKLSQPVESWCFRCKESTKLSGDHTRCIDKTPQWTLGDPPKYVERQPRCLNCQSGGRPRFVPVDATIPSIDKAKLSTFEKNWGKLPKDVKAQALGVEPKSSKTPRAKKARLLPKTTD